MDELWSYISVCVIAVLLFLALFLLLAKIRLVMLRHEREAKYAKFSEHFNFCIWGPVLQQIGRDNTFFDNLLAESYGRNSQLHVEAIHRAQQSNEHLNQEVQWTLDQIPMDRRFVMLDTLSCDELIKDDLRSDDEEWQELLQEKLPLASGLQKVIGLIGLLLLSVILLVPPWVRIHDSFRRFTGQPTQVHQQEFAGFRPLHFRESTQYGKTRFRSDGASTRQRLRSQIAFSVLCGELVVFMLSFSILVLAVRGNSEEIGKLMFKIKTRRSALTS